MSEKKTAWNGYQCFHCGQYAVYWCSDFTFEDYGYDGDGIVQECRCYACGADITYRIPIGVGNDRETQD